MTRKRETRSRVQIRAAEVGGKPGVTLHAIRPGVVDDYGSIWAPDAFDEALRTRLPTLCWAHDWQEPLGPATGFRTGPDGPEIDFQFSDFEAVPQARRAHAQVTDGTIADCSVGFSGAERRKPTSDELRQFPGVTEVITSAGLDEVSLVLRGAVPGAKVVSVRAGKVDLDAVVDLARRKVAGEITEDEARAALDLLGEAEDGGEGGQGTGGADDAATAAANAAAHNDAADAEADAALALIGRSAHREHRFVDMMADEVRDRLNAALAARFAPGQGQWLWIRDFSDVEVVFHKEGFGDDGAYKLGYTMTGGAVSFAENAVAVVVKTSYAPL